MEVDTSSCENQQEMMDYPCLINPKQFPWISSTPSIKLTKTSHFDPSYDTSAPSPAEWSRRRCRGRSAALPAPGNRRSVRSDIPSRGLLLGNTPSHQPLEKSPKNWARWAKGGCLQSHFTITWMSHMSVFSKPLPSPSFTTQWMSTCPDRRLWSICPTSLPSFHGYFPIAKPHSEDRHSIGFDNPPGFSETWKAFFASESHRDPMSNPKTEIPHSLFADALHTKWISVICIMCNSAFKSFNPATPKRKKNFDVHPAWFSRPVLRGCGAIQQLKAQTETFPAIRHVLNDLTSATGHRCHLRPLSRAGWGGSPWRMSRPNMPSQWRPMNLSKSPHHETYPLDSNMICGKIIRW